MFLFRYLFRFLLMFVFRYLVRSWVAWAFFMIYLGFLSRSPI